MSRLSDKQALEKWDVYVKNIQRETPVPVETPDVKAKRIAKLKGNFEEFCKYYFPNYTSAPFAKWQLKNAKDLIDHDRYYLTEAVFREGAKSVRYGLFIPAYLMFTEGSVNMLMVSHTFDNACELLTPLRLQLEHNQRIIADFGLQKTHRMWTEGKFVTNDGCSFRAIGAGQSPRGTRDEEVRPNLIVGDDLDTDEECRNETRTQKKWDWIEQALYPCFSITGKKRFVLVGNLIGKHGMIARSKEKADKFCQINILDKNGKPSWPERHTMEDIAYIRSKISYVSFEKEYMNNPITKGTVFKNLVWGKVPPLQRFKCLIAYLDSSYRSSASKKGDYKAMVLLGLLDSRLYIIKAFCDHDTLANSIRWYHDMDAHVGSKTTLYNYVEVNGMQDPWYEDTFQPAQKKAEKELNKHVGITPDRRAKPDKFSRIEGSLEPFDRTGDLVFNEAEKDNPQMQRLREQFEAIEPTLSSHDDGPDATEGGYWILNNKLRLLAPIATGTSTRSKKKRF
jgi:hypothetical protein